MVNKNTIIWTIFQAGSIDVTCLLWSHLYGGWFYVGMEALGQLKKADINNIFGFSETIVVMMMFLVKMLLQVLVQVGGKRRDLN